MLFAVANEDFAFLSIFAVNQLSKWPLFVEHLAVSMIWTTGLSNCSCCRAQESPKYLSVAKWHVNNAVYISPANLLL
jgi:hypothetical protein